MNEEALFALALEKKNAAERQALLDQACAGNAQLRAAIEGLLKASADAGSFLEHPPLPLDATVVSSAASRDTAGAAEWIARLSFLKPCDKPDRIGKLVSKAGEYEIIEVVGHGGMGAVLRAFDTKLSRVVAVKVMAPELAANPVAVRRFLREATTAAAVHHEHVVTIHAVDDSHQPPYLVMQFVEGQTLQDKIDHEGALELKHILRIGSQAAAGLAAAHKTGLIHRDVKPSNILLENGVERVKISDFGLARAADDVQMTQTGIISGTPQYMSPEQAKGEPIDAKSDLFSLGSVLYSMCTGRPAFRADNPIAVLRRVCDDTPRPIHETNPEIPDWLCEIVEKLMEKKPELRFQSAQDVADLLAAHLAHQQQPASCPLPPRVGSRPANIPVLAGEIIKKEARFYWATGILSLVFSGWAAVIAITALRGRVAPLPMPLLVWFVAGGLLSLPLGLLIMYAAWQVESRQSMRWAWTAALLSLLPINPILIFCLPITIWSLVTIRNVYREAQFASNQPRKLSPPPSPWPPPVWLWSTGLFLAVVGMLVWFLRVAFSLHSPPVVATVVGLGFLWVTAMCCWSFAIIFHQARFGNGSIASVGLSGAGLTLTIVVMFFGFLKMAFGYDTRPLAPYFVGLMLALVVAMAAWFVSALRAPPPASHQKPHDTKLRNPASRGILIEHPVLGCLAIFMLIVAASVATYMLTSASHRPASNPDSLEGQMALVVRAAKDKLSKSEWLRLSFQNPNLAGQLGDPQTKPLLAFLADLPDTTKRELLDNGYVKWPVASLPPEGKNAIAAVESTFKSEPAGSHRNTKTLQDAHAGYAIVDLPHIKQRIISWFVIWPTERHEWVTVVNSKALDNHPSYFAAHHQRFAKLRDQPDTGLPGDAPPLAIAPFDASQARSHQESWAKHLGRPVEFTNSIGMPLRLIPPGKGASRPNGLAQSAEPFFLGTTEVTVGQFRRFVDETKYRTTVERNQLGGVKVQSAKGSDRQPEYVWSNPDFAPSDEHPVSLVTWQDAAAFCDWLGKKEGRAYRLPTSDEWNWAARAGSASRFYFGDGVSYLDTHAWYLSNSQIKSHSVRSKLPNPWGLYDIYGNLWEVTYDFERGGKSVDLADAKDGPQPSERIYFWGGSFNGPVDAVTINGYGPSTIPYSHTGFRVAIVGDLKATAASAAGATAGLPSNASSDGWTQLFNGADLTGWKTLPEQPGTWKVEDGVLVGRGGISHLFSDKAYGDFQLRVEARLIRGDSGIFFRSELSLPKVSKITGLRYPTGYEAEIVDPNSDHGRGNTGSIRPLALILDDLVPLGEWFNIEVTADGNHLVTKVNGRIAADVHDSRDSLRQAISSWDAAAPGFRRSFNSARSK